MRIKTRISALRISLFMACLLPPLFFARDVNAQQFYWVLVFPSAVSGGSYSSPSSACAVVFDYFKSRTNWIESVEPVRRNDRAFDCFARGTDPSGSAHSGNVGAISRFGDSCPLGAEYNAATGSCDCRPGYEMDDSGCKLPDKNEETAVKKRFTEEQILDFLNRSKSVSR